MNPNAFHTTKITRKHFLQIALLSIVGFLTWSPFRAAASNTTSLLPQSLADSLPMDGVKDIKVLSQSEYDSLRPDRTTMYVITA